jgi:hypothetical protein
MAQAMQCDVCGATSAPEARQWGQYRLPPGLVSRGRRDLDLCPGCVTAAGRLLHARSASLGAASAASGRPSAPTTAASAESILAQARALEAEIAAIREQVAAAATRRTSSF